MLNYQQAKINILFALIDMLSRQNYINLERVYFFKFILRFLVQSFF
jgi:hypothetical protein